MQVLFVCVANVGRSQVAQELFNRRSTHQAESAGIRVGQYAGRTVQEWADTPQASSTPGFMLEIMRREEGIDFSQNRRRQLTPDMAQAVDLVVLIAERETHPDYLRDHARVIFWDIPDVYGVPYEQVRQLKETIKVHVVELVRQIG